MRILQCDTYENWIGFAFCVIFERSNDKVILRSRHGSISSLHPFCLSFESEYSEESFDMRLNLDLF